MDKGVCILVLAWMDKLVYYYMHIYMNLCVFKKKNYPPNLLSFPKKNVMNSISCFDIFSLFFFQVNSKNNDSITPLHIACQHNIKTQIIFKLVQVNVNEKY